ncbi:MAG: NAD(P)-dependent glycerol-3-phosphate dehydrogenase [Lentisphaerales bacterium]|nr:MAG: NAD(P)-dependent glycerol-3-phosphate dehydrogenase [Lentisphaerales bacterium]
MIAAGAQNIAVIGDGAWGTALALVLHANGHSVTVWSAFKENPGRIRSAGENAQYLPGVKLPPELQWTADRNEAAAIADIAVLAVPSRYFRESIAGFSGLFKADCVFVSVTKGLDSGSGKRMTEVAYELLGCDGVAVLSGPSHAEEVARGIPAAVALGCTDPALAVRLAEAFTNEFFRVYTTNDVIGVELGGALKNVIALAAGAADGIGLGDNTKAVLVSRGAAEIARLGCELGAERITFSGLSGIGDLIVTCFSKLSRNRGVGERIGRGEKVQDVLDSSQAIEGAWNCAIVRDLALGAGVEVPITNAVYSVLYDGTPPADAVRMLMNRPVRPEND